MAKLREIPCLYYINMGNCQKGRAAEHYKYCQKCSLYTPRVKQKSINKKKQKIEKVRRKEEY